MSGDRLDAIGIKEILAALPHRYPFLLVDRIIDIRGDEHGIGIKNVTINEPHFLGEGQSIILVEQNIKLTLELADDIAIINTGSVVFRGEAKGIKLDDAVVTQHLGVF